jgi:ribonuclease Y
MYILIACLTFLIGGILTWVVTNLIGQSKYKSIIQEAETEAEILKKDKLLEVKEKYLQLKSEYENQVTS